jgi:hypothetical protein
VEKVKIFTITHKMYVLPSDKLYCPIQVGNQNDIGILRDNTLDNISSKNPYYSELTGLYWVWKNDNNYDFIGLDHYRRHFCVKKINKKKNILKYDDVEKLLLDNQIILPKKRHYYIENVYGQYIHAHHKQDLDLTRDIISKDYPEYLPYFDKHMKETTLHLYNMFIMPKDIFNDYCTWLFDILFKLEKTLDISNYSSNDQRVFGFVAERLLDVYISKNNIKYIELPYVFMEKQNWLVKGINFVKRKITRK